MRRKHGVRAWAAALLPLLPLLPLAGSADEAADRKLFQTLDATGNGYLTGPEITPELRKYDANGDGVIGWEEFAAGRARESGRPPAPTGKTPPAAKSDPPAAPAAIKLPALAPKPGYILGRAVFADGRPIPRFRVLAGGWTGEINLGPSGTIPTLGTVDGQNGRYEIRPTSAFDRTKAVRGEVTLVTGKAQITYGGEEVFLELHPLDGKPDGSAPGGFRGDTAKGVVRDFVLRIEGPKRGFETNTPPRDTPTNDLSDRSFGAFYGGTIGLSLDPNRIMGNLFGASVTITLTPTGPLMDGTPGRPLVRTVSIREKSSVGYAYYLRDVPLGSYTATATLTAAGGRSSPLRLYTFGTNLHASAPVRFEARGTSGVADARLMISP